MFGGGTKPLRGGPDSNRRRSLKTQALAKNSATGGIAFTKARTFSVLYIRMKLKGLFSILVSETRKRFSILWKQKA